MIVSAVIVLGFIVLSIYLYVTPWETIQEFIGLVYVIWAGFLILLFFGGIRSFIDYCMGVRVYQGTLGSVHALIRGRSTHHRHTLRGLFPHFFRYTIYVELYGENGIKMKAMTDLSDMLFLASSYSTSVKYLAPGIYAPDKKIDRNVLIDSAVLKQGDEVFIAYHPFSKYIVRVCKKI